MRHQVPEGVLLRSARAESRAANALRSRAALACSLAALVGGCAGPPAPPLDQATYAPALNVDIAASTLVGRMYYRDLEVGTGAEAGGGSTVTCRYTGWLRDGTQFDSNQGAGFSFRLGAGEVIDGWDLGIRGMKVGGKRQLIIPPELGYGGTDFGPIPANSILVFEVTLLSVR